MSHHHVDLIDTTEMYLRTIWELEEEGVTPLRARIAERLGQSGPTVSQTVARMERDGLVQVETDRHLQLSPKGRALAVSVMRKHRLAERLLNDVIGLPWDELHIEACRWEHVMSEAVERRIFAMLDTPLVCPHGNPIPGLAELGVPSAAAQPEGLLPTLSASVTTEQVTLRIERISELLQPDAALMRQLSDSGMTPGLSVEVSREDGGLRVLSRPGASLILNSVADHIFVSVPA